MADKRISQLIERTDIANNDVLPIVASGATTTNKVTISTIQDWMQDNLDVGVTSVGITFGTSGTDINASGSPVTSSGNITINLPTASATNRGALSSADWITFNSKQPAGNYVTLDTAQTITAQKTFTTSGSSDTMIISHGSGSGFALDVIKAGNNEAIRVTKTSGSGNAMSIIGGNFGAEDATFSEDILVNGVNLGRGGGSVGTNTRLGFGSLGSNTSGAENTSVGYLSLQNNTVGGSNTVLGYGSMAANTSGSQNIAIGNTTLVSNTTGNTNIAIGGQAGRYTSSAAANTNSSNSIFIGYDTRASADSQANQIVIGHNAIGNGSNTVTIGNSSITNTYLRGTVQLTDTGTASSINIISDSTGNGAINIEKNTNGTGIRVSNAGIGQGIFANNSSTGTGILIGNTSTGKGLYIDNASGATGDPFVYSLGGAAFVKAKIDSQGNITGNSFIKSSGTSSQFLKADGSVDSSTYLTTGSAASTYLPLVGGTLTGGLNGTTGHFTTSLSSSGNITSAGTVSGNTLVGITLSNTTPTLLLSRNNANNGFGVMRILDGGTISFENGATIASQNARLTLDGTTGLATFTGALNGTSASFSDTISISKPTSVSLNVTTTASLGFGSIFLANGDGTTSGKFSYVSYYNAQSVPQEWRAGLIGSNDFYIRNNTAGRNDLVVTTAGNVGIGTPSPSSKLEAYTTLGASVGINHGFDAGTYPRCSGIGLGANSTAYTVASGGSTISFTGGAGMYAENTASSGNPTNLVFWTNLAGTPTERMRITSGGYLKASNTGSYANSTGSYHELNNNVSFTASLAVRNTHVSSPSGQDILFTASPNNTSSAFLYCEDGTEGKFVVFSNGDVDSRTNSYGGWSDIKLKENIIDASPKLEDLLKVKVKNYNFIGDYKKQLGVIAQELEEIFPALVSESPDFEEVEVPQLDEEGNEILNEEGEVVTSKEKQPTGTTTKSVKYSVFVPMLIKAIQELKAEIDSLKTK